MPCSRGLHSCFSSSRSLSQGSANATVLDVAQTGGHKKRVRRSSFLNAKKLYEDAQMARKVKQYLSNLELEMDEESLQTLSLQCEPATSTCECLPESAAGCSADGGGGERGLRAQRHAVVLTYTVLVLDWVKLSSCPVELVQSRGPWAHASLLWFHPTQPAPETRDLEVTVAPAGMPFSLTEELPE